MKLLAALLLLCAVESHANTAEVRCFPQDTTVTVGSTFWIRVQLLDVPTSGWAGFDMPFFWTGFNNGTDMFQPTGRVERFCVLEGSCPDDYGHSTCDHNGTLTAAHTFGEQISGFQSIVCRDAQYHYPALRDCLLFRAEFTAVRTGSGVLGIEPPYGTIYSADGSAPLTVLSPFGDWSFVNVIEAPGGGCGYCCTHYCDEGLTASRKASWGRVKAIYR